MNANAAYERHEILVDAPVETVDVVVRRLDVSSRVIRLLFAMRGLPGSALTREGLLRFGFLELEDRPREKLSLGLVGKFWRPTGEIRRCRDAAAFHAFAEPGNAKATWDFTMTALEGGRTRLVTSTTVECTDDASRRSFRRYWFFIRPFSGLIRILVLRALKRAAEAR